MDPYSGGLLLTVQRCALVPTAGQGCTNLAEEVAVPTPSLHAKGPRGAFEPLCRGLRGAGGRRRREGCSSGVASASESPPSSQPSSQAPAGAIATLSPNGEERGLQRETEARAPPMPGTSECSGERRAARDPEPLSLFPSRVPPPHPPTPHTPCLPVSLGNLQLKASHPHGNMYPSNKKKKVWREEKGKRHNGRI